MTWGEAGVEAVKNIPSSAIETGKAFVQPFIHPVETGKQVGKLVIGGAEKLMPGKQGQEETFDQFTGMMKDRYGSMENFKKTLAKDPVGVATDIASLFSGAGTAVKAAGTVGKVGKLAKAGETVAKAGSVLDPVNAAKLAISAPARAAAAAIPALKPSRLYQSAAKFSTALTEQQRAKITATALENEILPTISGLYKARALIDDYNTKITALIDEANTTGQRIPIDRLFEGFSDIKENILKTSGEPVKSAKAFDLVESEIRKANEKLGRVDLSPKEAQVMKQRIYKELDKEYSKTTLHPAKAEARMEIASNLKTAIEEIIPEVKQLNAKEGALIELNKAIEKTSARIQNRDILGIGVPIKGTVGGVVGGAAGAGVAVALGLLDTPVIKARLAVLVHRLQTKGIKIDPTHTVYRMGLIEAGELEKREKERKVLAGGKLFFSE
jgi:hypothetical protein